MEESCEVHEEDNVHRENSKKRTLKTPSQVEALEKLYNEHTYPSESMKSQLAEEIGLTEKQVSGWFCHRRLKDKNMLKDEARVLGRHDFSSGIIQDRGSALKQDSCSSTKPGEYKHLDPREVESRRFCGQESPTEDLSYRNRGQYMHGINYSIMDSTSGSTSPSQERMSPQSKDPYDMDPLRYPSRSSNYKLINVKEWKPRGHMIRSEYLISQDEIENAAILAVKRQLGRHYCVDGPPLGVRFESLPPSAFDDPIEDTTNGPYYVGDSIVPKSVGVLKVHKEPTFNKGYTESNRGMLSHNSYPEGDSNQNRLEPNHHSDCLSNQSLGKSPLTNSRSYAPAQYSSEGNIGSVPAGVAGILNKSKKHGIRPLHVVDGKKPKSNRDHFLPPYHKKVITSGSSYPRLHNLGGSSSENPKARPPMILQYDECLGTEQREHSRMTNLDEESLFREKRKSKENGNSVRVKMQLNNEKRRKTKRNDEYLPLDYASKTPSPLVVLPWEHHLKGYAGEIPTSFSDDETIATSSSMD